MKDLFTIKSIEQIEGRFLCDVALESSHPVYKGHFPGQPVTPGVCLLYIIKTCVSQVKGGEPVCFRAIRSAKFVSVVNPLESNLITVSFRFYGENDQQLDAMVMHQNKVTLKLKATVA